MSGKKPFFVEPKLGRIKQLRNLTEISQDLVSRILALDLDESAVIRADLVPERYLDGRRKFLKHGPLVRLEPFGGLEAELMAEGTPLDLRREAFKWVTKKPLAGMAFRASWGEDQRWRRVTLLQAIKGAQLFAYTQRPHGDAVSGLEVSPQDDPLRTKIDGADVLVKVPRTSYGRESYRINVHPVAIAYNEFSLATTLITETSHSCHLKTHHIQYDFADRPERRRYVDFCFHEVAAYLGVAKHYLRSKENNPLPLQMCPFPIPSNLAVDFYTRLTHNVLIQTSRDDRPRKLKGGEKEILLWGLVNRLGHDKTFTPSGLIKEYNWR